MNMTDFVAYYRVSTDRQGVSGLGLEAQRRAVADFAAGRGGILAEFTEVESGRKNDRPELRAALAACQRERAILVIAKLDRLARNVAFIAGLMESGVEFVAVDMPQANRLTIHILAAVAEHEREMISQRTRAALQAAKPDLVFNTAEGSRGRFREAFYPALFAELGLAFERVAVAADTLDHVAHFGIGKAKLTDHFIERQAQRQAAGLADGVAAFRDQLTHEA